MTLVSGFAFAIFVLAVILGLGVFATVARGLASGFSHSFVLAFGIVAGDLIFLLLVLAIFGLSAIVEVMLGFLPTFLDLKLF